MSAVGIIFVWVLFLVIRYAVRPRRQSVQVLEHQLGLFFSKGRFQRVLEPGTYRVRLGREFLYTIDTRTQTTRIEHYQLPHPLGVIRVSAVVDIRVNDPRRAFSSCTSYQDFGQAMVVGALHGLPDGFAPGGEGQRESLDTRFRLALKESLEPIGLELVRGEITELSFRETATRAPSKERSLN